MLTRLGMVKQCEQDNQPVSLTHYGLWRGPVTTTVSGKAKSTWTTKPYFVPSGARREVVLPFGAVVTIGGVMVGMMTVLGLALV